MDRGLGWLSDQARTRFGRRRPFMAGGVVLYAAFFALLYSPPHDPGAEDCTSGAGAAYWFGAFYILFYLSDTLTNVPYEALGPELSDNYQERNRVFFLAKMFNFLGMVFAAAAPASSGDNLTRQSSRMNADL